MTHVSISSSTLALPAKLFGFCFGAAALVAGLTQLPARHWVAIRQTVPVAISLAEAEEGFKGLSDETRGTIQKIDGQSESLAVEAPSGGKQLLIHLRDLASDYKLLGSQYELLSKQYLAYQAAIDKEFIGWSETAEAVEASGARIKEHQKILERQIECSEKLAAAKSDLESVARVLREGTDIERLATCAEHEMAIAQSLDGLSGLTTEIVAYAKRVKGTTRAVLMAWK